MEGPDRQRQLDGRQPDRPGAQHRRRDDGGGQRRPVEEDHRRREGRDPRAQEHDQHDGRPALARSRRKSRAWRARSAPKGKLGGQADVQGVAGTWKDLTESRELDGEQPDRPGAQHRRRDDGRRDRRPVEEDHRRRQGRDPRAQEHDQHDGRPAALVRVRSDARRARGRHRRQARRPGRRAGRGGHVEGPDRQRELRWPAT